MIFPTMQGLSKIKMLKYEASDKNMFFRFYFKLVYFHNKRKFLKIVNAYLQHGVIDANHMIDIIHTLNIFINTNIIPYEKRFGFNIEENDNKSSISWKESANRYNNINVRITDPEIQITTELNYGKFTCKSKSYTTQIFIDGNKTFYNTVGSALLYGIKKYL